jgi:hypothetical protein
MDSEGNGQPDTAEGHLHAELSEIGETVDPSEPASSLATEAYEEQKEDLERRRDEADVQAREIDNRLRYEYCHKLFNLAVGWLFFVGFFTLIESTEHSILEASDTVVITLLGTTTANVIGLFFVVAKWLFPERSGQDN